MYQERTYKHRGILDPNAFAQQVHLRCYEPSPALQPFVDIYFVARWHRPNLPEYHANDILTRPVVNMFFTVDGAYCDGITPGSRHFTIGARGIYAGVKFRVGAFHAFWPHSLAQLTGKTLAASHVFPAITAEYTKTLLRANDDQEVVTRLEMLLQQRHPVVDTKAHLAEQLVAAISDNTQEHTPASLAAEFQMSERTLQRLCQVYLGASAKWTMRRVRLLTALNKALSPSKPDWTTIAFELGYNSQSHFSNDFKDLIGLSPTQYATIIAQDSA